MPKTTGELVEKGFSSYLPVVVTMCLMCGVQLAMLMSCASIFYPVISEDLGVQTAEISAWMSLCLLTAALFCPVAGKAIERFDVRILLVGAVVIQALGFFAFSIASQPWVFWVSGLVMGIPNSLMMGLATATLMNRWFKRYVGLLMGICGAFSGIGGVLFLLIGQAIIDAAGWRAAYVSYAVIMLVICVPVILFCVRSFPADKGLLPYGTAWAAQKSGEAEQTAEPTSVEPSVAMKSLPFFLVVLFGFLLSLICQVQGFFPKYVNWVNEQAVLGTVSVAFVAGAVLASFSQAGAAIGKIGLGFFSDFSVSKTVVFLSVAGFVGIGFIWLFPATALLPVGGLVFGFFYAGVLVMVPMLTRTVFGEGKSYPVIYGWIGMFTQLGGAVANLVWPLMADNLGGFNVVFGTAEVGIIVVLVLGLAAYSMRNKLPRV